MGEMIVAVRFSELYDPVWVEQPIEHLFKVSEILFDLDVRPLQGRKIDFIVFLQSCNPSGVIL